MEGKKPVFRFKDYEGKDVAMHCRTAEEAEQFCKVMHDSGKTWASGGSYIYGGTRFYTYGEDTCYLFNSGLYGGLNDIINDGFEILEFSDFDWDSYENESKHAPTEDTDPTDPFASYIDDMLIHCKGVLFKKNKGYNTDADPTGNFKRAAALQGISDKQALIGMMDKHVVSVHDMVCRDANGEKFSESLWKEKIGDNINYLLILYAMTKMEG